MLNTGGNTNFDITHCSDRTTFLQIFSHPCLSFEDVQMMDICSSLGLNDSKYGMQHKSLDHDKDDIMNCAGRVTRNHLGVKLLHNKLDKTYQAGHFHPPKFFGGCKNVF
jgi:hypothetical protein